MLSPNEFAMISSLFGFFQGWTNSEQINRRYLGANHYKILCRSIRPNSCTCSPSGGNGDVSVRLQEEKHREWKSANRRDTLSREITDGEEHPLSLYKLPDVVALNLKKKKKKKLMSHRVQPQQAQFSSSLIKARCGMCHKR